MRQKFLMLIGFVTLSVALMMVLSGSEASAIATDNLIKIACDSTVNPNIRSAAADVVSREWLAAPPSSHVLFAGNSSANNPPECRRMGFGAQVSQVIAGGDPAVVGSDGKPVGRLVAKNQQIYLNSIAKAPTPERGLVWATAVVISIDQTGFAIVPGGLAQDLVRIQSCLSGQIKSNQGNKVAGLVLDCSQEPVRRAVADTIAAGFYQNFRVQPAVNLSCDDLRKQAEGGETVEASWAAAQAFVADDSCTPKTVEALGDVAQNGGSVELQEAAVAPLAQLLSGGDTSRQLLGNAAASSTTQIRFNGGLLISSAAAPSTALLLANAWGAGLKLASTDELKLLDNCTPTTDPTGPLAFWSITGQGQAGLAIIAPLARFDASECVPATPATFNRSDAELRLTIAQAVSGAQLPLLSFVTSK